jgi:putative phage-type endonuclease
MTSPAKLKDLQLIVTDFFNNYDYNYIKDGSDEHKALIEEIYIVYEHVNKDIDIEHIIGQLILQKITIKAPIYENHHLETIRDKITLLKTIKQPEQRSAEWHEFRSNRLTASDLATAIKLNPYGSRNRLIAAKCGHKAPFKPGPAIIHGVKFEPVATYLYEVMNNTKIYEYGCIPHPTIPHFAASPDGICEYLDDNKHYSGRMLEIKCPKSRPLTGFVPQYYELQIQGQLEVCDLEYCDYLECVFKEYGSFADFMADSDPDNICLTKNKQYRGAIFELYNHHTKSYEYEYAYTFANSDAIEQWEEAELSKIMEDSKYDYIGTTYWYLEKYDTILVKRDIERFAIIKKDIDEFWNEVLKHREIGYADLIKPKKPKLNEPSKETEYTPPVLNFLSDSD